MKLTYKCVGLTTENTMSFLVTLMHTFKISHIVENIFIDNGEKTGVNQLLVNHCYFIILRVQ